MNINLNPIQDTGEQKGPPYQKKALPPLKKCGFSGQILIKLRLWQLLSQKC